MFTGIIETIGVVKQLRNGSNSSTITITPQKDILNNTKIGDSIAINGICLTVTNIKQHSFEADIMAETLSVTALSSLSVGESVNLERALKVSDRLGGHIVSGHVDGIGIIKQIQQEDIANIITIETPSTLLRYIITRGSITIDGISLTVIEVTNTYFKVSIIPHTSQETTLLTKSIGTRVNLETDIIAKYVEKLLLGNSSNTTTQKTILTEKFLKENGF